jgi:hypothetical protein
MALDQAMKQLSVTKGNGVSNRFVDLKESVKELLASRKERQG